LEELTAARETIKRLQQKVENLEAIVDIRSDYEKFVFQFCIDTSWISVVELSTKTNPHWMSVFHKASETTTTAILRPFFRDHPGEPVPEENFWN